MAGHIRSILSASAFGLLAATSATAQSSIPENTLSGITSAQTADFGIRSGSFVAAPIPLSNPTIGSGLVVVAGYLFDSDSESDTSFFGLGGIRTDNGTEGYALAGSFALSDNRWKFGFAAGAVDANYDLFVLGVPIPLNQTGELFQADLAYGISPDLSFGMHLRYIETDIALRTGGALPTDILDDQALGIFTFGATVDYDTRDDTIFATSGSHVALRTSHGFMEGSSREYTKATLLLDHYRPMPLEGDALAVRLAFCGASDSAPFYDSCGLGGVDGFRGYPSTQFIDDALVSAQFEYRGALSERFGYAIFGGVGAVGTTLSAAFNGEARVAGGIGLRGRISKQFPLDFAVDAAWNTEGEASTYVYIGQRF
ncbi:BamA/TamA family outer membrane protein [Pseudoruegeria sp. SHC-113]|uniref:BamA/TamA family outer membrane protein n=1 Tax=Pseudoruegeria sp. SHC-113 TaxID=2855439 RepID=UPI0021BAA53E|nr:BamA/TamA family outer membrane protein [Pseudoruegeria sp. SHC-113]MCT8161528.1 BamA/TamA family outer membrane protein [Pseudoruegeria sp. SHC-113]